MRAGGLADDGHHSWDRAVTRPPAPSPPPGHVMTPRPVGETWRPAPDGAVCSRRTGPATCGQPAALQCNRRAYRYRNGQTTVSDSWFSYCPSHVHGYGVWVEDGQILHWAARPVETA